MGGRVDMDRLSKKKTEAAEAKVSKERIAGVAGSAVLLPFAFTLACRIIDAVSRVQLMITLDPYLHWLTTWWGQSTELIVGLLLLYGATVFEHKREAESHSLIFRPGGSHDGKPGLPAPKPKQQFVWIKIAVLPIACGIILAVVVWASIRFRTHQIKPPISTALPTEAAPAGPTVLPAQNHLSPQHKRAINQLPAPIPPNPIVHSSVAQSPPTPVPTAPNQGADDAPLTMSDPLVCPAPEKLVDAWFATLEQLASGVPAVNGPIEFSVDGPGRLMSVLHPLIRDKSDTLTAWEAATKFSTRCPMFRLKFRFYRRGARHS